MTVSNLKTTLGPALSKAAAAITAEAVLYQKRPDLTDAQRQDLGMLDDFQQSMAVLQSRLNAGQVPLVSELRDLLSTAIGKVMPFTERTLLDNMPILKKGQLSMAPGISAAAAKAENVCLASQKEAILTLSVQLRLAITAVLNAPDAPIPNFKFAPLSGKQTPTTPSGLDWADLAAATEKPAGQD